MGQVPKDAVLARLPGFPHSDAGLLAVPPNLLEAGTGGLPSFSTDPAAPPSSLSGCFFLKLPLPPKIPDYAIGLSQSGDRLFFTLVDSKRKIIVNAQVGSARSEGLDWEEALLCIRAALRESGALRAGGKKFRFVLAEESGVRSV